MRFRHLTLLAIISAVAAMIAVCYTAWSALRFPGDRGPVYDTWVTANETFQVRMTACNETGIIMPGAFYKFESAPLGSNEWREFKDFRGDDAIPIKFFKERFRFINAQSAYFYTSDQFLLTRDSGRNWSAWDPVLPGPDGNPAGWSIIQARVESDGTGKGKLGRYDYSLKAATELQIATLDYGQNWSPLGQITIGR